MGAADPNKRTFYPPAVPTLPADSPEIAALAGHVRAGRCALFVGAGLSVPAGLPTWGALIKRVIAEATPWAIDAGSLPARVDMEGPAARAMNEPPLDAIREAIGDAAFRALCRRIERLTNGRFDLNVLYQTLDVIYRDSVDRAEMQKLAEAKRFAELAGACRDRLGRERFHEIVRQSLIAQDLPPAHRDIVRTAYSCVVTTNFDTLLEDAYARYGGTGVPPAPTGAELGQHGTLLIHDGFFVLKAHGDAGRPDTMVFTADDYRRVIHATPAFQAVMGGILLTNAVLFVGYSLSDPNFRMLLDSQLTVFNGNVPPRYAILEAVGDVERDILWKTAKLVVLPYPKSQHQEVARCLTAIADLSATDTGTAPARGRAAKATVLDMNSVRQMCVTLVIDSDGDRVRFELVRRRPGHDVERLWVGGGLHPDTRALGAVLRRADRGQSEQRSPLPEIASAGQALSSTFPDPLVAALAAFPKRSLVEIACSTAATRIPWEWIDVDGEPLARRHAVVRRPAEITHEARGYRGVNRPLRALVLGDAGSGDGLGSFNRLEFADFEAASIEKLLRAHDRRNVVTRLSREAATHTRVVDEIGGGDYDIIHFGGHAWFDEREAFFMLWDRLMLGSELAPLLSQRPPALMVLDTHYTAFVLTGVDTRLRELVGSPSQAATTTSALGPRGFAEAAMRCGVTSFVGAFGDIGDRSGAELSIAFFANVLRGATVAEALRAARGQTARATFESGMFYTVFGYPDFRLVDRQQSQAVRTSIARSLAQARAGLARVGAR